MLLLLLIEIANNSWFRRRIAIITVFAFFFVFLSYFISVSLSILTPNLVRLMLIKATHDNLTSLYLMAPLVTLFAECGHQIRTVAITVTNIQSRDVRRFLVLHTRNHV